MVSEEKKELLAPGSEEEEVEKEKEVGHLKYLDRTPVELKVYPQRWLM